MSRDFTKLKIRETKNGFQPDVFLAYFDERKDAEEFLQEFTNSDVVTLVLVRDILDDLETDYRKVGDAYYSQFGQKAYKMPDGKFVNANAYHTKKQVVTLYESGFHKVPVLISKD